MVDGFYVGTVDLGHDALQCAVGFSQTVFGRLAQINGIVGHVVAVFGARCNGDRARTCRCGGAVGIHGVNGLTVGSGVGCDAGYIGAGRHFGLRC